MVKTQSLIRLNNLHRLLSLENRRCALLLVPLQFALFVQVDLASDQHLHALRIQLVFGFFH